MTDFKVGDLVTHNYAGKILKAKVALLGDPRGILIEFIGIKGVDYSAHLGHDADRLVDSRLVYWWVNNSTINRVLIPVKVKLSELV